MVECELEEEDDWVVVKKQKITILVSPSSPSETNKTQPKIVERSSGVSNKREHELTEDKPEEPSATPAPAIDVHRKSVKVPRRPPPIGALNVVNRRMRAGNLERKLEGMGGLRRWLVSQGLERFAKVFERGKVGKYELVNLTMSALKDMGTDAVGPRRKLLHAIDRLSQPYYFKAAR